MYTLGIIVFIVATIIIFSSDKFFKKGKITTIEQLFKIKNIGTGLLILSVILLILGKNN